MFSIQASAEKTYLWFPVKKGNPLKLVTAFDACDREHKVLELQIPWPGPEQQPDFWAAVSLKGMEGKNLLFCGDFPEERLSCIRQEKTRPDAQPQRPFFHLSPESGWMNDPNGLFYDSEKGIYHCYYQYHPFGTEWGPMYWGHAQSGDLLHWEDKDIALFPDETGTIFSGCAFPDKKGDAGFGPGAVLYYYTAAGGENPWSYGEEYTQRLAVSTDGGETLIKKQCILPHLADKNRDPMVFWHEGSQAYCMALYLEGNTFALFRSKDLLHFEETQRLELPKAWECPGLFPLPVEGKEEQKWVFWSADGFYFVGSFDGYRFQPEQARKMAYLNTIPYAAQPFSGLCGKAIQMTWLRLPNTGENRTGMMAIPASLSLVERNGSYILRTQPAIPLEEPLFQRIPAPVEGEYTGILEDRPVLLEGVLPAEKSALKVEKDGNVLLELDGASLRQGTLLLGKEQLEIPEELRIPAAEERYQLIADRGVLELRLGAGLCWAAVSGPLSLEGRWSVHVNGK